MVGVSLAGVRRACARSSCPWSWVPGGHLVEVRGSEVFSAAQLRRGETYASMQRHLGWASLAVSLAVALALGLTTLGRRLARAPPGAVVGAGTARHAGAAPRSESWPRHPSPCMRSNALEYGLTEQSLGGWLRDQVTSLLVSWVFAGVMVLVVLVTARRSPRRWPLWAGLAGALLDRARVLGLPASWSSRCSTASPRCPRVSCARSILALAEKEQVPVSDVLVADASRRTTTLNAYVSGFGSTKRVVLYDNLVEDVPEREALVVVAHELGHARHHDVLVGTAARGHRAWCSAAGCSACCCASTAARPRRGRGRRAAGGGGAAPGHRRCGVAARQPGREHDQPGGRGPGRPGLARGDRGLPRRSSGRRCSWRPGPSATTTRRG